MLTSASSRAATVVTADDCQDVCASCCPPLQEQARLSDAIEQRHRRSRYDAIAARTREIDLLREYRTRLIADVVTGKLDVREAAARLPDEVDEPEPLDEAEADIDVDADEADEIDAVPEEVEA